MSEDGELLKIGQTHQPRKRLWTLRGKPPKREMFFLGLQHHAKFPEKNALELAVSVSPPLSGYREWFKFNEQLIVLVLRHLPVLEWPAIGICEHGRKIGSCCPYSEDLFNKADPPEASKFTPEQRAARALEVAKAWPERPQTPETPSRSGWEHGLRYSHSRVVGSVEELGPSAYLAHGCRAEWLDTALGEHLSRDLAQQAVDDWLRCYLAPEAEAAKD
jgi:hypothetical protein